MKKNKILLFSVFIMVLVVATNVIFAATSSIIDTTQTGTLTILTREQSNGSTETTTAPVISGIEYTLYRVADIGDVSISTIEEAEAAITSLTAIGTQTTGTDGKTIFTNLQLGRYYAKVTGYPTGTSKIPDSFLVDIPMTNETGDAWEYDVVADPKVQTASGAVTLTLKDDEGNVIPSAVFKLQISTKNTDSTWSDWTDYIPDGTTSTIELTTDSNGQIQMTNIPITYQEKEARYRFYNTASTAIINNNDLDYIYITDEGKTVIVHADNTEETAEDVAQLEVIAGTTSITATAQRDDGTYAEKISAGVSDTIKIKTDIKVPYNIADLATFTLMTGKFQGLNYVTNIKVVGVNNGTETTLTANEHYTLVNSGLAMLTFTPEKISGYEKLIVTYDITLDINSVTVGGTTAATNAKFAKAIAQLTYTQDVQQDTTEDISTIVNIYTSGLRILKTDYSDNPLSGATFKIAATKADAEAGNFLKDTDGNDLVAVSGDDGYTTFDGLAFSDDGVDNLKVDNVDAQELNYYLVETQAPTYTEEVDGVEVTKSYKLLTKPVEVTVTAMSNSDDYAVEIVNRKPLELPKTGGIGIALFVLAGLGVMGYSIYKNKKQAKNIA